MFISVWYSNDWLLFLSTFSTVDLFMTEGLESAVFQLSNEACKSEENLQVTQINILVVLEFVQAPIIRSKSYKFFTFSEVSGTPPLKVIVRK